MATLEWFTIEPQNFRFSQAGTLVQIDVSFAIYGLTASSAAEMMTKARQALPAGGTSFNSVFTVTDVDLAPLTEGALFQNVIFNGNTTNAVSGLATFTTATGLTPSTLTITIDARTVTVQTNMGPDGTLINASFFDDDGNEIIRKDTITSGVRVPLTAIIVEGLKYGNPDLPAEGYVGYVLSDTFRGRPKGSWLVDSAQSSYSVYSGNTSYRICLLGAPGGKKWWTTGILRSNQTGQTAYYDGMEADIMALMDGDYAYGEQAAEGNGYSIFGYYYTVASSVLELP